MHQNALSKIRSVIQGSLEHCHIVENWPQFESFSEHVHSLSKELLKHKSEWLTMPDVFSIYYDLVYEFVISKVGYENKFSGLLSELFQDDELLQLTDSLVGFYRSIPRRYSIYIPLPKVSKSIAVSVRISELLELVSFNNADQIPGGYGYGIMRLANTFEINKIYLKTEVQGYCNNSLENPTVRTAITRFKILIQQGLFRGLFTKIADQPSGMGLLSGLTHYQLPKYKVISVDLTGQAKRIVSTDLPIELTRLLDSLDFNWEQEGVKKPYEDGKFDHSIHSFLRFPSRLIESDKLEAEPIRTAIEWCLDSQLNENETLSFIQVCIGLEALLGDAESEGSITEILADRCAYLTSSDIRGRAKVKKQFKDLYKARSKIVHGVKVTLDQDKRWYKDWGQKVLEFAIAKEMKNLNL